MSLNLHPLRADIENHISDYFTGSNRLTKEQVAGAAASIVSMLEKTLDPANLGSAFDVRNIMLDVVPGDGESHEVYAKTTKDVEEKLGKLYEEVDALNRENDKLTQEARHLRECASYAESELKTLMEAPVPLPTFDLLRRANIARLPTFRNAKGELSHTRVPGDPLPGGDWSDADWFVALTGELGELGDLMKKVRRGDLTKEEAQADLGREIADVMTYLDILAMRLGVNMGEAVVSKFNEVSKRVLSPITIEHGTVVDRSSHEEA